MPDKHLAAVKDVATLGDARRARSLLRPTARRAPSSTAPACCPRDSRHVHPDAPPDSLLAGW